MSTKVSLAAMRSDVGFGALFEDLGPLGLRGSGGAGGSKCCASGLPHFQWINAVGKTLALAAGTSLRLDQIKDLGAAQPHPGSATVQLKAQFPSATAAVRGGISSSTACHEN
jgi:hypothetical protein